MKSKTNISSPGGTGVLILKGRALPVTCVHEFEECTRTIENSGAEDTVSFTKIWLTDQASGSSKYGLSHKRDYRDVDHPLMDVVLAYNLASRGHVIDVDEFCQKRAARNKGSVRLGTDSPLI
jgi:hypothetical protein